MTKAAAFGQMTIPSRAVQAAQGFRMAGRGPKSSRSIASILFADITELTVAQRRRRTR